MRSLAQRLARAHGGSVVDWRRRLRQAGVRAQVTEAELSVSERVAVQALLAAPAAPQPPSSSASTAVAWTRRALQQMLAQWEPWRLAPKQLAASYRRHARTLVGPMAARAELPLPEHLPSDMAPWFGPEDWTAAAEVDRRLMCTMVGLRRSRLLGAVAATLSARAPASGVPARVVCRIAAAGGARTVAPTVAWPSVVEVAELDGVEVWRLPDADAKKLAEQRQAAQAKRRLRVVEDDEDAELGDVRGVLQRRYPPAATAPPLVLSKDAEQGLASVRGRWRHRDAVKMAGRRPGVIALFVGEAGFGKRTAATQVAVSLGLELFAVQSARLSSRYIGETEQRITALFEFLEGRSAAVLIDSAEDLMGKRGEVGSANDRYANMSVNHLLQTLERWPGLCILTAPTLASFDPAMQRRIDLTVPFDTGDGAWREALVSSLWGWLAPRLPDACTEGFSASVLEPLVQAHQLAPSQLLKFVVDLGVELHLNRRPVTRVMVSRRVARTLSTLGFVVKEELL